MLMFESVQNLPCMAYELCRRKRYQNSCKERKGFCVQGEAKDTAATVTGTSSSGGSSSSTRPMFEQAGLDGWASNVAAGMSRVKMHASGVLKSRQSDRDRANNAGRHVSR